MDMVSNKHPVRYDSNNLWRIKQQNGLSDRYRYRYGTTCTVRIIKTKLTIFLLSSGTVPVHFIAEKNRVGKNPGLKKTSPVFIWGGGGGFGFFRFFSFFF